MKTDNQSITLNSFKKNTKIKAAQKLIIQVYEPLRIKQR